MRDVLDILEAVQELLVVTTKEIPKRELRAVILTLKDGEIKTLVTTKEIPKRELRETRATRKPSIDCRQKLLEQKKSQKGN